MITYSEIIQLIDYLGLLISSYLYVSFSSPHYDLCQC